MEVVMGASGYAVIVERGSRNCGAYSPDVPGCVTTGATVDEALANMREALEIHLEHMAERGTPLPEPHRDVAATEFVTPRAVAIGGSQPTH
jgi:predicted RNase H-like HicB family nuclease